MAHTESTNNCSTWLHCLAQVLNHLVNLNADLTVHDLKLAAFDGSRVSHQHLHFATCKTCLSTSPSQLPLYLLRCHLQQLLRKLCLARDGWTAHRVFSAKVVTLIAWLSQCHMWSWLGLGIHLIHRPPQNQVCFFQLLDCIRPNTLDSKMQGNV